MFSYYSIIIILFILAGAFATFWYGKKLLNTKKNTNYLPVSARLIHKDQNTTPSGIPEIVFLYQVNGNNYEKQILPDPGEETMPGFETHFRNKYPHESNIEIYYNPENPEEMVFSLKAAMEDKVIFGLGIGAIILGTYAFMM